MSNEPEWDLETGLKRNRSSPPSICSSSGGILCPSAKQRKKNERRLTTVFIWNSWVEMEEPSAAKDKVDRAVRAKELRLCQKQS